MSENIKRRRSNGNMESVSRLYREMGTHQFSMNKLLKRKGEIAKLMSGSKSDIERDGFRHEGVTLKENIREMEENLRSLQEKLAIEASQLPNWCHADVPLGPYEDAKVVGYIHEDIPVSKFERAESYEEIGRKYDLFDFESAAKVAGSKFCYFRNDAVFLEMSLLLWASQELRSLGFVPVTTPEIVRENILFGTGFNPRQRHNISSSSDSEEAPDDNQIYQILGTNLALIGTSEIPLVGMNSDRILPSEKLPLRYVGSSHCFRHEAGGGAASLYRLHQFSKIEMVSVTDGTEEASEKELHFLLEIQKRLLTKLGLHCRVLELPTEDLGAPAYHKYDIEAWMPSFGKYGEVTSTSNCLDYQSRRLNIRSTKRERDEEGEGERRERKEGERKNPFVHTVNGTALAVPRIIIAILEQCQDSSGRVVVPECLVPIFGKKYIG